MFCFIHQWRFSRSQDTGRPPAPATLAHMESCEACRRFAVTIPAMTERLSADAAEFRPEAPPFMASRIMAHVKAPASANHVPGMAWRPALAGATVAALLVALLLCHPWAGREQTGPVEAPQTAKLAPAPVPLPIPAYGDAVDLLATATQRAIGGRYEAETGKLLSDARSMKDFLFACVPVSTTWNETRLQ